MKARVLTLTFCVLVLAACRRPKTAEPLPVCSVALPRHLTHTKPDALPASVWYQLLIKGYAGKPTSDAVDCSGEPIAWPTLDAHCGDADHDTQTAPRGAVRDDELIVRTAGGDFWFAWAPLWRLDNGMAEGPLAIAYSEAGRLEARAIGTIRAYTGRARIEVRHLGDDYVLSVEGEHCRAPRDCTRAVRLAYLDRQRFRGRPLRAASVRSCLAPAWFPLAERLTRPLDARWTRSLSRELSLAYDEGGISIDERILVQDHDRENASLPPRLFRQAQSRMRITVREGELMTEGQSLWSSIRLEDASLQANDADADAK
ncbi:MAG: hypothetical protein ABW252_09345 [Polyangiales bacterium]